MCQKWSVQSIEHSILVKTTTSIAYSLWADVEEFPRFWETIREVRPVGGKRFLWVGEENGQRFEATVELTLQIPNRRIAWRTLSGPESSGVVGFEPESAETTRIVLKLRVDPSSPWYDPAATQERVVSALHKFKELVESR